jgi:uncharacterized protein (TIGR02001 family)
MKKTLLMALVASTALFIGAHGASAQERPQVSFNVGAATDYVFRGVSLSNEKPQIYAGADVSFGGLYGGLWTSTADYTPFGDTKVNQEVDVYGGWKTTLSAVAVDVGAIYYGYVNQADVGLPQADFWELYGKASVPVGAATLGAAYYYSPKFGLGGGKSHYFEANAAYTVGKFTGSGTLGRQEVEFGVDYTTWNLGVGYALTSNVSFDVRYWDTDAPTPTLDEDDARIVGGVKVTF